MNIMSFNVSLDSSLSSCATAPHSQSTTNDGNRPALRRSPVLSGKAALMDSACTAAKVPRAGRPSRCYCQGQGQAARATGTAATAADGCAAHGGARSGRG